MSSDTSSTPLPRVLGVLIARNEWPLLGICITHALVNHVDELIVVDHASTDETQAGLAALQKRWGKKIQVLHMAEGTFHHEETNLLLKSIYQDRDFDWVYPIDADEFLVTENKISLKELLSQVPENFDVARYELHNFVAPSDFVEKEFHRYVEIRERAVANSNFTITHKDIFDSIMQGGLNFFDVPFPSKVMFRRMQKSWPVAGSHSLNVIDRDKEFKFDDEKTFVSHLPFLTKDRFERRAIHGKELMDSGYSIDHGWQSQVVNHMKAQGRLSEYWERVSIHTGPSSIQFDSPRTVEDNRLAPVLIAAVSEFLPTMDVLESMEASQQYESEPAITMSQGVEAIYLASQFNKKIAAESEAKLRAEIARLGAEQEELKNSISWRATKLLRVMHRFASKIKSLPTQSSKFRG